MRSARLTTLAAAAGIALLVAACGGSSTRTVTRTVVQKTTPPTTTTQSTPTATVDRTACTASHLTPTLLGSNGAAGTIVLGFALKNTGSQSCTTYGWPGVELLSAGGSALPTNAKRTTSDVVGSTPATLLTLKPGEEASFRLVASDVPTGGGSCPTAAKLQIYAPNDTVAMVVGLPGISACGRSSVSPMMPGDSAFAGQGGGSGTSTDGSGAGSSGSDGSGSGSGSGSGGSGSDGSGSGAGATTTGGGQTGVNGSGGPGGSGGSGVAG
jgi:hypothetical protein